MPKHRIVKFGAAVIATAAGVILAVGPAAAHSSPAGGLSVSVTTTKAALKVTYPFVAMDPAANMVKIEQEADAIEAAEKAAAAAALAAEQAKEAAEKAAELAAQQAAATCQTTDTPEDINEKAARQKAEAAEPAEPAKGSPAEVAEDAAEKALDTDPTEARCPEVDTETGTEHKDSAGAGSDHEGSGGGSSSTSGTHKD